MLCAGGVDHLPSLPHPCRRTGVASAETTLRSTLRGMRPADDPVSVVPLRAHACSRVPLRAHACPCVPLQRKVVKEMFTKTSNYLTDLVRLCSLAPEESGKYLGACLNISRSPYFLMVSAIAKAAGTYALAPYEKRNMPRAAVFCRTTTTIRWS